MSTTEQTSALTRRQVRALAALVEHVTVADAATASKIGASTIRRWLATDRNFSKAVSELQAQAIDEAFARLAFRSSLAVETLEKNLTTGVAGVETRAALGFLSLLHKRSESSRYQRMEQELERLAVLLDEREERET